MILTVGAIPPWLPCPGDDMSAAPGIRSGAGTEACPYGQNHCDRDYYPSAMIVTGESQRHAGSVRSLGAACRRNRHRTAACLRRAPAVRITDIGYCYLTAMIMTGLSARRPARFSKPRRSYRSESLR